MSNLMSINSNYVIEFIQKSSLMNGGFPPSFEGNPWIFTLALFCTMVATLVSFVQVYANIKEMINIPDKISSPINVYRLQLIIAYLIIIFGAGPDAVYLWTFNEVTASTTQTILSADRIFDSLFLIPFSIFTWLQIKCGPILKFQLVRRPSPVDIYPVKPSVTLSAIGVLAILFMSVIVTILK